MALGEINMATRYSREAVDLSRKLEYEWSLGLALTFNGVLSFASGDAATARGSYGEALIIQRRIGDNEGIALSLGGLAQLSSMEGKTEEAIELYKESLTFFEAMGDRAEEARILEEMAWTILTMEQTPGARGYFLDAVQAYKEVGSMRGVGLALMGLAATAEVENSPYRAVQIAAAAELFSEQEGIVNVYAENNPGKEYIESAESELSARDYSGQGGRAGAIGGRCHRFSYGITDYCRIAGQTRVTSQRVEASPQSCRTSCDAELNFVAQSRLHRCLNRFLAVPCPLSPQRR
jgi:tetratricopeptide (TPR) repeat protein